MPNPRPYGYSRFTPEEYDFTEDTGLMVGQTFLDFDLHTLDGTPARLSDYLRHKPLVLETGSMTCPMYAQSVPPMQALIRKYPQLDHVLLYVREAHPGERQPQHASLDAKLGAARTSCARYHEENRPVLVDTLDGAAHQAYGSMPNSVFIIAPDGTILFRSLWNNAAEMDMILGMVARGEAPPSRELKAVPPFSYRGARTLFYGGVVAIWDFVRGLPRLIANHRKVGNM